MATPASSKPHGKTLDDSGYISPLGVGAPESEPQNSLNKSVSELSKGELTYDEEQENPVSPDSNVTPEPSLDQPSTAMSNMVLPNSEEPVLPSKLFVGRPFAAVVEGTNTPLAHIGETMASEEAMSASGTSQMVSAMTN